eukprot:15170759-Ditylum_brightwellii.AAC.1
MRSLAANVAASAVESLGTFVWTGKNSAVSVMRVLCVAGAGPMYHASVPCGAHDACLPGSSKMTAHVPGGASGTLLKLCGPSNIAWADSLGLIRACQRRLSVK